MMMPVLELPILAVFAAGLLCLLIPRRFALLVKIAALAASIGALGYGVFNFVRPLTVSATGFFVYTPSGGLVGLGCAFFTFIVVLYSLRYADFIEGINRYYGYILWCAAFGLWSVYSANFIVLTVFWGLSGMVLYLLAGLVPGAANAAKKSFVFIGGSDALMVLGIALLWQATGSFDIYRVRLDLAGMPLLPTVSFLCLATAALTKAGAMPFHTWIPDFAENVPMSLTAFLPASVDKLLGIFLLVLVTQQIFVLNAALTLLLLTVGALTVIFAVYMAMIQHDLRRLLSYHAVSQVGYMVLGIATGSALGVAAGVFHMVNHALYKSALFLTGGAVESKTGTTNLDRLGGLSRFMPLTFVVCLVASLSISGIPPLNGFASKWMVYQSLIDSYAAGQGWAVRHASLLFLIVALFGSALTLASFVKLIHSVFLGQPSRPAEERRVTETGFDMGFPMALLALLCVLFGVFPFALPLDRLILPGLSTFNLALPSVPGIWDAGAASAFIFAGIFLGLLMYLFGAKGMRRDRPFVGGEDLSLEARAAGTEFYKTVADMGFFSALYRRAERKLFDIYHLLTGAVLGVGGALSRVHTGSLHGYLLMFLAGLVILAAVYFR